MNIVTVAQSGRLMYEALLLLESFYQTNGDEKNKFYIAIPRNSAGWKSPPDDIPENIIKAYKERGGIVKYFDNDVWASSYPHSNKIFALSVLPENENFIFLDSDNVILKDLSDINIDFSMPSAAHEGEAFKGSTEFTQFEIWDSIYKRFSVPPECRTENGEATFPYYNAGAFYYKDPKSFHDLYLKICKELWFDPHKELKGVSLNPWLDQIALPLVIRMLGGGQRFFPVGINTRYYPRSKIINLDSIVTLHYHKLSNLYIKGLESILAKVRALAFQHKKIFSNNFYFDTYLINDGFVTVPREIFIEAFDVDKNTNNIYLKRKSNASFANDVVVDYLKQRAKEYEIDNPVIALELMRMAHKIRPNGAFICSKILEYKTRLGISANPVK